MTEVDKNITKIAVYIIFELEQLTEFLHGCRHPYIPWGIGQILF